jgi:hypothetical protein
MGEWISIYNEMPAIGQEVLLLTADAHMFVGHRYHDCKPRKTVWQSDFSGISVNNEMIADDEMVTHWMPLPKNPKGEN